MSSAMVKYFDGVRVKKPPVQRYLNPLSQSACILFALYENISTANNLCFNN